MADLSASAMLDRHAERLLHALKRSRAARIVVETTKGSAPRDAGTWMGVVENDDALIDTIGGGRLELDAIAHARALLAGTTSERRLRMPLGPSLGQCCGGVVEIRFELLDEASVPLLRAAFDREHDALPTVALFGGGHVGRAIVRALAPLPLRLTWIDSRDEIFPAPAALGLSVWPRGLVISKGPKRAIVCVRSSGPRRPACSTSTT